MIKSNAIDLDHGTFHKLTQSDGALKMRKLKWQYFTLREKKKIFQINL